MNGTSGILSRPLAIRVANNSKCSSPFFLETCFVLLRPNLIIAKNSYTLSDALAVANYLNGFIRQAQHIGMANIAQSANVLSPILTTPTSLTKQTIYYPLLLFSQHMRGEALACHVRCAEYTGSMQVAKTADGMDYGWLRGSVGLGLLDVSAAVQEVDGERWATVAVTNASPDKDWATRIEVPRPAGQGGGGGGMSGWGGTAKTSKVSMQVYTVAGRDVHVTNCQGKEEVGIRESTWEWDGEKLHTFPRASFTMLRWKA